MHAFAFVGAFETGHVSLARVSGRGGVGGRGLGKAARRGAYGKRQATPGSHVFFLVLKRADRFAVGGLRRA